MKNVKIFRSRISILITGFVLGTFIYASIPSFQHMKCGNLYISGGAFVFVILLFSGMRYVISETKLYVKIMWIIPNGSVNIADIVSVKRSYNPLSSPAGSLKRLCIRFRKGAMLFSQYWLISPYKEREFIETLKAINPNIQISVSDKKGWRRIWDWDI